MEKALTPPVGLALAADLSRPGAARGLAAEEFDELVRQHHRRIYRVLLAAVRDPDAADTLTQECFLRAYRSRKGFRGEASVGTWLMRIALNLAADYGRSRRNVFWRRLFGGRRAENSMSEALEVADPRASPERRLAAREELGAVWAAAQELAPQQRTIFFLRFSEEMTLEEIAQALVLEVGTVKSHLFRAVGAVRERLKEKSEHAGTSEPRPPGR